MTLVQFEPKSVKLGTTDVKKVYLGSTEVRPNLPYLCFTANTAGSKITLGIWNSPTSITFETSTDGENWNTYTLWNEITLSNVGDRVYFRNTSETTTGFSKSSSAYYKFQMSGSIAASGDISYLLNKNGTDTLPSSNNYTFANLFDGCSSLTSAPKLKFTTLVSGYTFYHTFYNCSSLILPPSLPATTLTLQCYDAMFAGCNNLEGIPALPAATLQMECYRSMFYSCHKLKLSATQTGEYQTAYRIPTTGTGTTAYGALDYMFGDTGGTAPETPSINTTYYTSNTVV